ncbi:MAG: hypothetical protein Q8R04_00520 [Nanoarchaeota archaeon]|nr:hypothetical protein [Nanoarchaeota archaeon]
MSEKQENDNLMPTRISRMSLTEFDTQLAIEFMDKNNDGRCDLCGMPVEQCIDGGQLECSMDPNAKIGILGSQHIHADFKVNIDGKSINFANPNYYMKSSFLHLDDNQNKEDASGVLHMHASGVPLWIFFNSIGMNFDKDCITLENREKFCNDSNKKLKFFVNGKESNEFENYVFNDLDKILISYGDESEEEIKNQLASITDFARIH